MIFWSSVIQLHTLSTHSQQVNDFIPKFKYKFNFKIVTGFQTNMLLLLVVTHSLSVCSSAKLWKLLSSSTRSKRDNEFMIHIVRLFKLLLGFMYTILNIKTMTFYHFFLLRLWRAHNLSIFAFGLHKHNCFYINTWTHCVSKLNCVFQMHHILQPHHLQRKICT